MFLPPVVVSIRSMGMWAYCKPWEAVKLITNSPFLPTQDVFVSPNPASTSTASTSSHHGRRLQLPTTTSDDVFMSSTHTSTVEKEEEGEQRDSLNEFDAVERSGTLQHVCTHISSRSSDTKQKNVHHCTNVSLLISNQSLSYRTKCHVESFTAL